MIVERLVNTYLICTAGHLLVSGVPANGQTSLEVKTGDDQRFQQHRQTATKVIGSTMRNERLHGDNGEQMSKPPENHTKRKSRMNHQCPKREERQKKEQQKENRPQNQGLTVRSHFERNALESKAVNTPQHLVASIAIFLNSTGESYHAKILFSQETCWCGLVFRREECQLTCISKSGWVIHWVQGHAGWIGSYWKPTPPSTFATFSGGKLVQRV